MAAAPIIASPPQPTRLPADRRIARNVIWNFGGLTAPIAVAAFAIPPLLRALGADRFGILMLGWSLVGYFSLFDLGLGRAVSKVVAEKIALRCTGDLADSVWTALLLSGAIGCAGGCLVAALARWLAGEVLKVPVALQGETVLCLYLIAATVPVMTVVSSLRGVLEAQQRFAFLSTVRVTAGTLMFLGPLLVAWFSKRLPWMMGTLVLIRLTTALVYGFSIARGRTAAWIPPRIHRPAAVRLLRLGGWMTVSNVISPVMVYLDRFLIGSLISVGAVTYYATPHEVITKLLLVPSAIVGVLFPVFSGSLSVSSKDAGALYRKAQKTIAAVLLPLCLLIFLFARQGLTLWLGAAFAAASYPVLQILALGIAVNGFGMVAFALIQAADRPDITAKLHAVEAPLYLAACWWLVQHRGIHGAALAWTGRVVLDTIALLFIAARMRRRTLAVWPQAE